jgi:lipoprotein-anchoring transpeptidase ErfK/SrfK
MKPTQRIFALCLTGAVCATFALLPFGIPVSHAQSDSVCFVACAPDYDSLDSTALQQLSADMTTQPSPVLQALPVNDKVIYGRAYRRVLHETDIYSAPNGAAVGHLAAGLNFVKGGLAVKGWVQIGRDEWLPQDAVGPMNANVSRFSGVTLPDGLPDRAFGWVLTTVQPSRTPGTDPDKTAQNIKRYTLVTLFAVKNVDSWNWYLIGPDQWIIEKQIARIRPVDRPVDVTGKWYAVDLYEQTLTAYDGDKAVFATLISSGLPKWPTAEGLFKIWDRQDLVLMTGGSGQPDYYNLPEVPWAQYFNKHDQSIHGAYWHDGFGFRRSHGCVNLSLTDALWAFTWAKDSDETYAYIYHSGEYRQGAIR